MGRLAEAVVEAERAVQGDPLSASANLALGSVYHVAGRLDDALAQFRKTINLEPNDPRCYELVGSVYRSLGLYGEMAEARRKELRLRGASDAVVDSMLEAYRAGGYPSYLRWSLHRAGNPYGAAALQAGLGMKDEAFANLEKAYQGRWCGSKRAPNGRRCAPTRDSRTCFAA
jgi:tetratricopeptide (TPR) repeat protein